ncbi:MAG: Rieske 2Fe-2S domain-containing protein [Actinomycetota bacterium]|nr:Rieske 2Fe-2S domain-containing protein [Actinomycetota bacterium]
MSTDPTRPQADTWRDRLGAPGWVLLPQRIFLGLTFAYAGLQKLSDPHYFAAGDPQSVAAQMANFRHTSPLGPLIGIAADHAHAAGLLIAIAEIAVGLGTLVGLWTRAAAAGGALLSLTFLLTVSWATTPYYYGSDIVFLVMWVPLIAVGAAGVLSADAALAARRDLAEPAFGRRAVIRAGGAAGALAVVGLGAAWAATFTRGRLPRPSAGAGPTPAPGPGASGQPRPPTGKLVVAARVPVGGAVLATDPRNDAPVQVLQPVSGQFQAYSAICTHAGCTVAWTGNGFSCPCHGATYDATGQVTGGPAPRPLSRVPVRLEGTNVVLQ